MSDEIEEWQEATGLLVRGHPAAVTPAHLSKFIKDVAVTMEAARSALDSYHRVLALAVLKDFDERWPEL